MYVPRVTVTATYSTCPGPMHLTRLLLSSTSNPVLCLFSQLCIPKVQPACCKLV